MRSEFWCSGIDFKKSATYGRRLKFLHTAHEKRHFIKISEPPRPGFWSTNYHKDWSAVQSLHSSMRWNLLIFRCTGCPRNLTTWNELSTFTFQQIQELIVLFWKILKNYIRQFKKFSKWLLFWRRSIPKRNAMFTTPIFNVSSEIWRQGFSNSCAQLLKRNRKVGKNAVFDIYFNIKELQGRGSGELDGHAVGAPLPVQRVPIFWWT